MYIANTVLVQYIHLFRQFFPASCHATKKGAHPRGGMTLSLLAMSSMKRVTPGHVGLIEDGSLLKVAGIGWCGYGNW